MNPGCLREPRELTGRLWLLAKRMVLIVGGNDTQVLALNRAAQAQMPRENRLAIVPGATHLFEESGALEEVARLAAEWFTRHVPD